MKPTLQEKYDLLCKFFKVTDIDLWENDAMLRLITTNSIIYFQFSAGKENVSVDDAVEALYWEGF